VSVLTAIDGRSELVGEEPQGRVIGGGHDGRVPGGGWVRTQALR
jgi:hypothetical protein